MAMRTGRGGQLGPPPYFFSSAAVLLVMRQCICNPATLNGKRDRAIVALPLGRGLRRREVTEPTLENASGAGLAARVSTHSNPGKFVRTNPRRGAKFL
jgi:hypothetical protein